MGYPSREYEHLALDDFEDLYADKPRDERWELIGARLVRRPAGARWEHGRIVGNIVHGLENSFEAKGTDCRTFAETFYLKSACLASAILPPTRSAVPDRAAQSCAQTVIANGCERVV